MTLRRIAAVVLAGGCLLGALALALAPGVASAAVDATTTTLGNDYFVLSVVGVLALALSGAAVTARAVTGPRQAAPSEPESGPGVPAPGAGFDRVLEHRLVLRARLFDDAGERVRTRLRTASILAQRRAEGCSRPTARQRIDTGTWTDDPEAAAFLGGTAAPDPPLRGRVLAAIRGESWFRRGARRTEREIAALAGTSDASGETDGSAATDGRSREPGHRGRSEPKP